MDVRTKQTEYTTVEFYYFLRESVVLIGIWVFWNF